MGVVCLFGVFRVAPTVYGGSQARGQIGTAAAGLHHRHSNAGSELCLRPTPQPRGRLDPQPTERGQGSNLHPHGFYLGSLPLSHNRNSTVGLDCCCWKGEV